MTGSQSLERGLSILELIDSNPDPVGVREIARRTGLGTSTVQRLINTLLDFNYIEQDPATRRYRIGHRAFGLGASFLSKDRLISAADAELRRIAASHELNGYLGVRQNDRALYLLCVQSGGPIGIRNSPGELAYLHATAMGKVLLAALSDDQARVLLGDGPLPSLTPATITSVDSVIEQLQAARQSGFATVFEETILGVISVGVPVFDHTNKVRAAVSLAFAERSSPHLAMPNVIEIARSAATRVSKELGWTGVLPAAAPMHSAVPAP